MTEIILISLAVLGGTGILAALVLYAVARKFHVYEDPLIAKVEAILPGANCGGCGLSGCHAFAVKCVTNRSLEGLRCPGAGDEGMERVAACLGLTAEKTTDPLIAVLHCNGTCENRQKIDNYEGVDSCALLASVAVGTTACSYGCLGCGDCVKACPWDALSMDSSTGLPVVDASKCVACGSCVVACPRRLFELRRRRDAEGRVWVACANHDRGPVAMKVCKVSCIACGKCKKVCEHDAVTIENMLSYIDDAKCVSCGACVEACPRKSIHKTLPA